LDPGSEIRDPGWVKRKKSGSRIQDKHPGSATLQKCHWYLQYQSKTEKKTLKILSIVILKDAEEKRRIRILINTSNQVVRIRDLYSNLYPNPNPNPNPYHNVTDPEHWFGNSHLPFP
jgi:hypothetical protein